MRSCLRFLLLLRLSAALRTGTGCARRRPNESRRGRRGARLDAASPRRGFELPIFPLRKRARLPTEVLTLNLYEDRFLALAEAVLATERPAACFGALYASDKPQIVKDGRGPIVPLLTEGDIGVLFVVTESREDMVPTVGGELRRRIRVQAQGAARFRVERVLCSGFESENELDQPPYITVEARLYQDEPPSDDLTSQLTAKFGESYERLIHNLQASLDRSDSLDEDRLKAELDSFALASKMLDVSNLEKRLQTPRLQSLTARLGCLPEL